MTLQVLVVGGGRVGAALASLLHEGGHEVTVIERAAATAAALAGELVGAGVVHADGADPAVLEAAGIRRADTTVAVTGDDARNLVICSLARSEFEVPRTVARVVDPAHAWAFGPELGVDVALDQADLLARLTLEEMSLGEVATLVKLRRGDLTLVEERLPATARSVGSTLAELDLPPSCVLVGIIRDDEVVAARPGERLEAGDEVLAIVHAGEAAALTAALDGAGRES
jgi:trk system potassium uptake protein